MLIQGLVFWFCVSLQKLTGKLHQKISFDLELEIQKIKRKLFLMLSNFLQSCYKQMVKLSSKKQLKTAGKSNQD